MNETKEVVMQTMKIIGQLNSKLRLSNNILGIVMKFHGGIGDAMTKKDLAGLIKLLEKREFLRMRGVTKKMKE